MFQVTWASPNVPFYPPIFYSPYSHPFLFFLCIPCQSLFSHGSVPAPGEFNLSLSIDLDDITSGFMSSFSSERERVKLFYLTAEVLRTVFSNPHLWLSVSLADIGRGMEGRGETTA